MIVQQFQMRGGGQGPAGGMGVTTVPVMVSASIIGTIIGRGGDTIRMLQASTGAKVQVTRGFDGQPEREITISGTQQQVSCKLICCCILLISI
jgi:far upstream element-binding protein